MTSLEVRNWTPKYYITNQSTCQLTLQNLEVLKELPLLNNVQLHNIKDKQLVRFHGMIQDMYDPEYYLKQYVVKNMETGESHVRCGMYTDLVQLSSDEEMSESDKTEKSERHSYVVISVPGLNEWAKEKNTNMEQYNVNITHSNNINKRSLDNDNNDEEMSCSEPVKKKEKALPKNDVTSGYSLRNPRLPKDHVLNFPIPTDEGKACIVKSYDETKLKLNQVIDVIGFVSLDPLLSTIHDLDDGLDKAERDTHNPPTSLVPRLHAIKIVHLEKPEIPNAPEIVSKAQLIRNDLHTVLSQLLFGDRLAADYLICHLLSTIYCRKDDFCIGTFSLNITNIPASKLQTFPKEFYNFLTLLVRKSHFLEVTLDNLNKLSLIPQKNYDCNRLTSGILQLSDHTHLLIDETSLAPGRLFATGKKNYKALSDLLQFQKVIYDFKYYTMDFDADFPILIFSDAKSFIPCQIQINLNTDAESENLYPQIIEAACCYLKDENRLTNIRQYLEVLSHTEFDFDDDITKIIQEDFVQMRCVDKNIVADNLHILLVFARLMSLSYGETSLSVERWKKTVELEMERMNRLPQRQK